MRVEECCIAYCNYSATGEGVTTMLAVGCSPEHAKAVFNQRAADFFQDSMMIACIGNASVDQDIKRLADMVPLTVWQAFERNPFGTTEYFSVLHFNLA